MYTIFTVCLPQFILWTTFFLDTDSIQLKTLRHNGDLEIDQNYTVSSSLRLPEFITGDVFIVLDTDIYDQVYEYLGENNNLAATEVCDILVLLWSYAQLKQTLLCW